MAQFTLYEEGGGRRAEGGGRSVEIGRLMFGGTDPRTGRKRWVPLELLRRAIPRRVYTQSHIDYVIEVAARVAQRRESLRGLRIIEEPPQLRSFTARLAPSERFADSPVA